MGTRRDAGGADDRRRDDASKVTYHALYALSDVEAALGAEEPRWFDGDPPVGDEGGTGGRAVLRRMLDAREGGRWRSLAHPDDGSLAAVASLGARAPHMGAVTDLVLRRLRGAAAIGLPVTLPPLLLLGPPGVGKSWYMARLARALGLPYRLFPMNLATLADGLSGSHPIWRASAPGLVARTLLAEALSNPVILVDELDKPPPSAVSGDLYRPLHALLEPENAATFVDECLGVPLDASAVLWVATANVPDPIPVPILDRLTVIEVGAMSRYDRVTVLRTMYADLNRANGDSFDPDSTENVLAHLESAHPRRARQALDDGMMRAAADGRHALVPADVGAPDRPVRRPSRRRDVH